MYAVKKNHTRPLEVRLVLREKHGLWHLPELGLHPSSHTVWSLPFCTLISSSVKWAVTPPSTWVVRIK